MTATMNANAIPGRDRHPTERLIFVSGNPYGIQRNKIWVARCPSVAEGRDEDDCLNDKRKAKREGPRLPASEGETNIGRGFAPEPPSQPRPTTPLSDARQGFRCAYFTLLVITALYTRLTAS